MLLGVVGMPKKEEEDIFVVWEENWEIVLMFIRLQTQWDVAMGGVVGLKYEVLPWLCDLYSIKDVRTMFEGLQVMEATALKEMKKDH